MWFGCLLSATVFIVVEICTTVIINLVWAGTAIELFVGQTLKFLKILLSFCFFFPIVAWLLISK